MTRPIFLFLSGRAQLLFNRVTRATKFGKKVSALGLDMRSDACEFLSLKCALEKVRKMKEVLQIKGHKVLHCLKH